MKKLLLLPLLLLFGFAAGAQCVAAFSTSNISQNNLPLWILASNTSSYGTLAAGQSTYMHVSYGDGSGSSGYYSISSFNHNYTAPGTYNMGLRISKVDSVTHAVICTDTVTHSVTVGYSPCATSTAMTSGSNGQRTFTATNYLNTSGMTYSWTFGDGYSGSGTPITHTYASSGSYVVMLHATGGGCTWVDSFGIYVAPFTPQLNCTNLHANFTSAVSVNNATFTNTSTAIAAPYISSANWYFGDGSANSFVSNPTHAYAATGTYNVQLITVWHDSAYTTYCSDTIIHAVTISSVQPPPSYIQGNIYWDSAGVGSFDSLRVYLIQFNSVTNMLSAVDSTVAAGFGAGFNPGGATYHFSNPAAGSYLVKAVSLTAQPGIMGNVPTYHDSSLYWNMAQTIVYTSGINTGNWIWMKHGIVTSGPGFVSGNVSLGANKGANNGVAGMNVFIRNAAGQLVKNAVTDANGDFNFYSVPAGTYSVYPENLNYATTPATNIIVTNGAATVSGVNFNQDNTQHNIRPRNTTGITNVHGNDAILTISPNPASKAIILTWGGADASAAHIIITGITGNLILDKAISGAGTETIDVSALQPGIYFLRGTQGLQGNAQKLVIE